MPPTDFNLESLQKRVIKCEEDLKTYKALYNKERKANLHVRNRFKLLEEENHKILRQKDHIEIELSRSEKELLKFKPSKHINITIN